VVQSRLPWVWALPPGPFAGAPRAPTDDIPARAACPHPRRAQPEL